MDTINTIQQVLMISINGALTGNATEPIFNYNKPNPKAKSKEISKEYREETLDWIKQFSKRE